MQTGDILVTRNRRPTWFNRRTIAATGGVTHHNGVIVAGNEGLATTPYFQWKPISDRYVEPVDFAIYRLSIWSGPSMAYLRFQDIVRACVTMAVDMKIPYDLTGVWGIYARVTAQFLATSNTEWKFWCTESVCEFYKLAGYPLCDQPNPAPVHIEQLIQKGTLVLVEDHGLHEAIIHAN